LLKPPGYLLQQLIASLVAQGIVDNLEAIQVDEADSELPFIPLCGLDGMVEHLAEHHAVGQTGQAIVRGQKLDSLFGLFARGDVVPPHREIRKFCLPDPAGGK